MKKIEKYGMNRIKILEKKDIIGYNIMVDYFALSRDGGECSVICQDEPKGDISCI